MNFNDTALTPIRRKPVKPLALQPSVPPKPQPAQSQQWASSIEAGHSTSLHPPHRLQTDRARRHLISVQSRGFNVMASDQPAELFPQGRQSQIKSILVIQQQKDYAHFWQQVLGLQGHIVLAESPQEDLLSLIRQHLPDMVLVDMSIAKFNPYALCRDCRDQFPQIKVVLAHPPQREVQEAERRWASYQGAAELISTPKDPSQVEQCLNQLYKAANWDLAILQEELVEALQSLNWIPKPEATMPPISVPEQNTPEQTSEQQVPPPPQTRPPLMYRGRPVLR